MLGGKRVYVAKNVTKQYIFDILFFKLKFAIYNKVTNLILDML